MSALERVFAAAAMTLVLAGAAAGQVIPIKTVPVATGDQFLLFPSARLGMASVTIALEDTVGDPFANPATMTRVDDTGFFSTPTAYSVTDAGGAITLPAGAVFAGDGWHGAVGFAFQELDRSGEQPVAVFPAFADATVLPPQPNELGQKSRTNLYAFGGVARSLGTSGRTAIGASAFLADLTAVSGVDLLYDRRTADQRGGLQDLRVGLTTEWPEGQAFEAVLVHSRFRMEHDFVETVWEPVPVDTLPEEQWPWQPRLVESTERDRTLTWGLHMNYVHPLAADGWRVGGLLTANRKSHPEIPNYTLMSIPRDPGDSWAYDLGVGISKRTGSAVFGVDFIYEPIRTQTWADAAGPVATAAGDTIPAGDMTVFNDFEFDNAILRMGLAGHGERLGLHLGIQLKRYAYTLDQQDFVLDRRRRQHEDWIEWTPSLALSLRFPDFAIRYTGRITTGTGRPGVTADRVFALADGATALSADFLPAPSGSLTLQDATVHTHQVSVSIPFR